MDRNRFEPFDAANTSLHPGINLIEASAGTGKTFAIAMLALRFVVELDLRIEQLLIVTFTKAATEELKERIRTRLAGAKRALDGQGANGDAVLAAWMQNLAVDKELARQRLQLALLDIDRAGIFTIHGFCFRILNEHALESGQVFDAELSGDLHAIRQQIADDFWRQRILAAEAHIAALLIRNCKTPNELLMRVGRFGDEVPVFPEDSDLDSALAAVFSAMHNASEALAETAAKLRAVMPDGCFKSDYSAAFEGCLQDLENWLSSCSMDFLNGGASLAGLPPYLLQDPASLELLSRGTLLDSLNGTKFKTTKTQSGEERRLQYLDGLQLDTEPFDALQHAVRQLDIAFRSTFIRYLRTEHDKALQRLNLLSFDKLIGRLAEALRGEHAAWLQQTLRERFKAALIDEFQDTDQQQWHIFSTLFGGGEAYLYLIGDPKQAIYKFRGADIFSYFAAQRQAQRHFTLEQNWRSQPLLVEAVNSVFQRHPRPFWFEDLHFINVRPGLSEAHPELLPPLQWWQLPPSETKDGYWTAGKARDFIQIAIVDEILRLCRGNGELPRTPPQDIAILVRTNQAARDYQLALQAVGVAAVLNSVESVFVAPEAHQLYMLLQALAYPSDMRLLKQALALPWFGLDGQALYRLGNDEELLDAWMLRVQDYHRQWQSVGLMAMMLELLRREQVHVHLTRHAGAERRIANIQHLLELVQQAAIDEHLGLYKTLDWLLDAIVDAEHNAAEECTVRLESDAHAVQIVTLHRSKGLEYPVVFCPDLWQSSDRLAKENELVECHENGCRIVDLGSTQFAARRARALQEELAEDLRIVYVALTRAKYRCYVAWADVRSLKRANASALAYLLFSDGEEQWQENLKDCDFVAQQQRLQDFCRQSQIFGYRLLEAQPAFFEASRAASNLQSTTAPVSLVARSRSRHLYTDWQMTSYTALSALSRHDAPELPEDKAQEADASVLANEASIEFFPYEYAGVEPDGEIIADGRLRLPKGAHTGNAVHALLETVSFRCLAEGQDIGAARDQACLRYGLKLEQPQVLDLLLQTVVQTPLSADDSDFTLANLAENQCLKEMPFYLSMQCLGAERINTILEGCPAFQPLLPKQLQGFLTGFIDLVCAYQGRYYVMDYKTNTLAGYDAPQLLEAMRAHNYGLQYWLYTLVLHRYLQNRLPHYDYAEHFGGVRYLFVRGMSQQQPMRGVFQDRPQFEQLQMLDQLFR